MIAKNSAVKIQSLIVNQESQPIKSNPVLENEKDCLLENKKNKLSNMKSYIYDSINT